MRLIWVVLALVYNLTTASYGYPMTAQLSLKMPGYSLAPALSLDYPLYSNHTVSQALTGLFQLSSCQTNLGLGFHRRQEIVSPLLNQWGGYLSQQTQYHHDPSRLYTAINTGLEALSQHGYVSLFHTLGVKWGSQRSNTLTFPGTDIQFRQSIQKPYHALGSVFGYRSFLFGSPYQAQFNLSAKWWYHADLYPKRIQTQVFTTTVTKRSPISQQAYPVSIELGVERGLLSYGFVYRLGLKYQSNFVSTDTPKKYSQTWPLDLSAHVLLGSDIKPEEAAVFLNKIMNIVVINLDKHTDRLATSTQFIHQMGLNLDRFRAVNGCSLYPTPQDAIDSGIMDLSPNAPWSGRFISGAFYKRVYRDMGGYGRRRTTPNDSSAVRNLCGHLGCSLSHIGALERYKNSNKPFLWVLEDDAIAAVPASRLVVKLYRMFESYAHKLPNVDVILFHDRPDTITCSVDQLGRIRGESPAGAHAYLVPTAKIPKIIEKGGPPFKGHWDKWWNWSFMGIRRYGLADTLYPRQKTSSEVENSSSTASNGL